MARMFSRKRGTSGSHKPVVKEAPTWVEYKKDEVEMLVVKLRKQECSPAMIGTILRDQYGIPSVKLICGVSVVDILKKNKLDSKLPEDMLNLIKTAVNVSAHMKNNKKDVHSMRGLLQTESKIRRLAKYYKKTKVLPADWFYNRDRAKLLVQ
ncbi:MAG: 30S ribosomal protein S15 [Candidatus Aenigmarchaeota archaeon]|nr:30S ribosomal protein S15 [Candidatus Aenigmarchaeota archaeon]